MNENTKHEVKEISTGTGYDEVLQNVCSCGWKGKPIGVYNSWYPTILNEEAKEHLELIKGE